MVGAGGGCRGVRPRATGRGGGVLAPDGSFAPRSHGPAVGLWAYAAAAASLLVPAEHSPRLQLDDDSLPIVTSAWDAAELHVETPYFSGWPGGNVARWFQDHGAG